MIWLLSRKTFRAILDAEHEHSTTQSVIVEKGRMQQDGGGGGVAIRSAPISGKVALME